MLVLIHRLGPIRIVITQKALLFTAKSEHPYGCFFLLCSYIFIMTFQILPIIPAPVELPTVGHHSVDTYSYDLQLRLKRPVSFEFTLTPEAVAAIAALHAC